MKYGQHSSRRGFLKSTSAAILTAQFSGLTVASLGPASAQTLASGMTGGPTGFDGAERFQYDGSMSEGRAIQGIMDLKESGNAPQKLTMLLTDGAIGQITDAFPEGAPSVKDVWERETGIELEIIGAPAEEIFTKVIQDVTTGSGAFDIYTGLWNSTGDVVSSGGAVNLSDYVAQYGPDWGDPVRGTPTAEMEQLMYTYGGEHYSVALDGDFQTWFYLQGLYERGDVRDMFAAETGAELTVPNTWEEVDRISEFFTGKDFGHGTMYGNGNLMSPFWGLPTFYSRFASMESPNNYLFDEEGNPNLATDLGVQCLEEHIRSLEWSPPDALSMSWSEAYASFWNMQVPHLAIYTNIVKFGDGYNADGSPKSAATGQIGSHLPVGRRFGNDLVRRSVLYASVTAWVSAKSEHPEAAYLFLQWLSSTRTYSWMAGNPGGYFDPMQQANFAEPLVASTYHSYAMETIPQTIARSAPTINFAGQTALDNALDEELQAALTGQKSAREAMEEAQRRWERTIQRQRRNGIVEAIIQSRQTWPTIIDTA